MKEIKTEIEISSSRDNVWQTLMDFKKYDDWNTIISEVKAVAEVNRSIRFKINVNGNKLPITARIQRCEENCYFGWGTKSGSWMNRIIGAHHYFELHEISPEKCKVLHGEVFYGIIPFLTWPLIRKLKQSYEGMNRALKHQVESQMAL